MRKGRDIIGKPIVTLETGERVASVQDLVFDQRSNELLALLVDEGGWFRAARVVPLSAVRSFGEDAVVIGSPEQVVAATDLERVPDILNDDAKLIGTTLMTTDGKNLGRLADLYFDEIGGKVVGYDVTGGLFSDLSSGRSFVPAPETITFGSDVAMVPPETALAMEEAEPGGLKGALNSAGQSVQSTYQNAADATKERQRTFVVGKIASREVTASDGDLIVAAGEPITEETARFADEKGALNALFLAAGGGALQETFQNVRDRVQEHYEDLSTASKERQKQFVTGKIAGNDVTAPDGTVIVTKGDEIMPEMVDFAEEKNALPRLLAAAGGGLVQQGVSGAGERLGDLRENLETASAERQRDFLIGKTAEREVIADDGTLIVGRGAVVNEFDVARAQQHGATGALLAAVTVGGLATSAANAREGLAGGLENVSARISDAVDTLRAKVAGDGTTSATPTDNVVGRRVMNDVYGPAGMLLAAQGQIVTPAVLQDARAHGRETELIAATRGGTTASVSDRLVEGTQSVAAGASSLVDRAKEWINERAEQAQEANEQRRINNALGRPVTRVILDPSDDIILNVGEIVTHKAVDMARAGGVLEILLDSVSTDTTPLTPEDVKPHATGSAALQVEHDEPARLNEDGTPQRM